MTIPDRLPQKSGCDLLNLPVSPGFSPTPIAHYSFDSIPQADPAPPSGPAVFL